MAYVIKVEIIKPDTLPWFNQSSPDAWTTASEISTWIAEYPGFLASMDRIIDSTYAIMYVFDTAVNGQKWYEETLTRPDCIIKGTYYQSGGAITNVTTFS